MERDRQPNHKHLRAALLAASLLVSGCQSEAPPEATPKKDNDALEAVAEKLDYDALTSYEDPLTDEFSADGHNVSIMLILPLEEHSRLIQNTLPLFADPAELQGEFNLTTPKQNQAMHFLPQPSPIMQHTFIIAPTELPAPGSDRPFAGVAFTATPVTHRSLNNETYSVIANHGPQGHNEYERRVNTFQRSIITELCQAVVAIEPVGLASDSPDYLLQRSIGQEMYCNSISHAYGAAQANYPYQEYLKIARRAPITVPNLVGALPSLLIPEPTYERFRAL